MQVRRDVKDKMKIISKILSSTVNLKLMTLNQAYGNHILVDLSFQVSFCPILYLLNKLTVYVCVR